MHGEQCAYTCSCGGAWARQYESEHVGRFVDAWLSFNTLASTSAGRYVQLFGLLRYPYQPQLVRTQASSGTHTTHIHTRRLTQALCAPDVAGARRTVSRESSPARGGAARQAHRSAVFPSAKHSQNIQPICSLVKRHDTGFAHG